MLSCRYCSPYCPYCDQLLKVPKSKRRTVYTLDIGPFIAKETILGCDHCPEKPQFRSPELAKLVAPGCKYGYDVMTFVGEQLYRQCQSVAQSAHTAAAREQRNVPISESQVRNLAARFIISLGLVHVQAIPRVREHLAMQGGYILHLDSTSRAGSMKLLSGIDELSGLVLLNVKLTREGGAEVTRFLKQVVGRYGTPLAICCDMASALRVGCEQALKGVPVHICHFHFLRDCGKDLMESDYRELKLRLAEHQIEKKLEALSQELQPDLQSQRSWAEDLLKNLAETNAVEPAELSQAQHRAIVALHCLSGLQATQQGDGLGFPFDLPALRFYQQLLAIHESISDVRCAMALGAELQRLYDRLRRLITGVAEDPQLRELAQRIENHEAIFARLRQALRLGQPGVQAGLNDSGQEVEIKVLEQSMCQLKSQLEADKAASTLPVIKLIEQMDRHWHGLFRPSIEVTLPDGTTQRIQPHRTNNILL